MLGARSRPAFAQAPAAPAPAATAELRFGALFPLSGPLALLGDEAFRGLELATEARNAAGGLLGRPLRLLRTDVTEPALAQAEARRLAGLAGAERPVALFGTLDSQLALAATQPAELAGMPYFELLATAEALVERGFRLLFRSGPPASALAQVAIDAIAPLARLIGATPASLPIGILNEEVAGPQAVATTLDARLKENGLNLAARAGYTAATPAEIGNAVRRLRAADARLLLHCGRGTDAVALFRALREEGWHPRAVIGLGGGYALAETARTIGPDFDGTLLADLPQPRIEEGFAPGLPAFAEAYRKRYGAEMRAGQSLACFSGAQLFYEAIQRAGVTEAARIRAALAATDLPFGALPNGWGARFDERGQNTRARAVLLQWQGEKLVAVQPEEAAVAPLALPARVGPAGSGG